VLDYKKPPQLGRLAKAPTPNALHGGLEMLLDDKDEFDRNRGVYIQLFYNTVEAYLGLLDGTKDPSTLRGLPVLERNPKGMRKFMKMWLFKYATGVDRDLKRENLLPNA
jgi:hypothetical protein